MVLYTLKFNKSKNSVNTIDDRELLEQLALPRAKQLKINLIEIKGVDNPSGMTIILKESGDIKKIHLHRFRTEFILQNNIFIWNTSGHDFFDIKAKESNNLDYTIEVQYEREFDLLMYCSTDQIGRASHIQEI